MDDEHLFFVAVVRELSPDDRSALDQAGIDIRHGPATGHGPWQGEFHHLTPSTRILRVRAQDEHAARLRVVSALGDDDAMQLRPVRE